MKLRQTITSHMKPSIQYGEKGEEIRVIAEHGEVVVVEGKSGRFPVKKEYLVNDQVEQKGGDVDSKGSTKDNVRKATSSIPKAGKRVKAVDAEMPSLF